ncbi:uncharacterized protein LOC134818216 [Bolinopsis microptera]|uniref:uncharacterized protein LOC134818216 n=1 Tax=Bolinopsis microptera TaxID=2820187 RepID=UPI003078E214
MTSMAETCIKKPPRPWSADINYKRNVEPDQKCYTTRSDVTYDKYGRGRDHGKVKSGECCGNECNSGVPSNPPPTPVNPVIMRPPQLPGRQPLTSDEGRCIRLRTISHSAPPLNFKTVWNPLSERHPGSAFDVVSSSASSSRTCSPDQVESRAELCVSYPDFDYVNPIIKPIPRKGTRTSFKVPTKISEDQKEMLSSDEETLPDRLFRENMEKSNKILQKNIMMLEEEAEEDEEECDGEALTLPDKLFKAHMAKQAMEKEGALTLDVKPKIITKSLGSKNGSIRNGLKDKFVLKIIENFNEQSNVLKELSNMKLDSKDVKPKKSKKKSLSTLKKTWSSIMNLAVGVPGGVEHAQSKDNLSNITNSKQRHLDSLYSESMYSSLVGDIYKSRSTACIAAL